MPLSLVEGNAASDLPPEPDQPDPAGQGVPHGGEFGGEFGGDHAMADAREGAVILKTRQGRYRVKVKVKDHGVIVADRTFTRWNDAEAWEADRKRQVAVDRLTPAGAGRTRDCP